MTTGADTHVESARRGISAWRRWLPRGLFGKYAVTIVCLVVFVLAVNGSVEAWIIYRNTTTRLSHAQREAADRLAARTDAFLADLERQVSWVTRASATTLQDRQSDYTLLLQQVPAVSKLMFVDGDGRVQLEVTRDAVAMGSNQDLSHEPDVIQALSQELWLGDASVHDHGASMVLTMAHSGTKAGATIATIDLAALSDFADALHLAETDYAYVINANGVVLGASKASPVKVGTNLGTQPAIKAIVAGGVETATMGDDDRGHSVIRTSATIDTTRWASVAEEATKDALRPLSDFALRLAWLLAVGLVLAILAGLVLARRLIGPIEALHAGATHLAAKRFDHRISIRTGDELEELAEQFNRMAGDLADSYGRLEIKVEERTRDLAQSVRDLRALEESGRALSSSLDLAAVQATIISQAVELTHSDAGAIFTHDDEQGSFQVADSRGLPPELATPTAGLARDASAAKGTQIAIPDLSDGALGALAQPALAAGFRSALIVDLESPGDRRDALVMYRKAEGAFPASTSMVMQTLVHQSVLALHNARLFQELARKSHQLELANAYRTQFFANMSHELRTPLNAVLGYAELLGDGLYGALPERAGGVLERIQANGQHLLGLINDVLDITKMEAGGLSLSLNDYSMRGLIDGVVAATESLAKTKGLAFEANVPNGLPIGRGDDRRLTQVLVNLVGNAIKFTDEGEVRIEAAVVDTVFHVAVRDTGPGISKDQQLRIFDEFQQVDDASTRKKGGTGLGLAISRRLLQMHGGHIDVLSAPGEGATFTIILPVRVAEQRQVA